MKIIQEKPDDIDAKIQKKVLDVRVYRQVHALAEQLRPVSIALDKAQADSTTLADAYSIMKNLMYELEILEGKIKVSKENKVGIGRGREGNINAGRHEEAEDEEESTDRGQ